MHMPDAISLNQIAQWVAIIGGGTVVWSTLRRIRTNDLHHLEKAVKEECKEIRKEIGIVRETTNETRDRVMRLEGWRNGLKGGSPGGK